MDEARQNGSIIMYAQEGTPVVRFDFQKGWPSKISSADLSAESEDVAIETLTIVHEYIERVAV